MEEFDEKVRYPYDQTATDAKFSGQNDGQNGHPPRLLLEALGSPVKWAKEKKEVGAFQRNDVNGCPKTPQRGQKVNAAFSDITVWACKLSNSMVPQI